MKIIDNILDDYYTKILIKEISYEIKITFPIDVKIENEKNVVSIYVKPRYYSVYTRIMCFCKNESLKYLCDLQNTKTKIIKRIENIEKNNYWNKRK